MKVIKNRPIHNLNARVRNGLSRAMRQWGQIVVSDASDHAPILTGALRRSIKIGKVETFSGGMSLRVGTDNTTRTYSRLQEFGTVTRYGNATDEFGASYSHPRQSTLMMGRKSVLAGATRPWLRPAFKHAEVVGRLLVLMAFKKAMS